MKGTRLSSLPLLSHPTDAQHTPMGAWTHRRMHLHNSNAPPHNHHIVIHDTFQQTSTKVDVVSNASICTRLRKAAVAWLISETPVNQRQAVIRKAAFEDSTSYWLKLEGLYDGLKDAHQHVQDPTTVSVHCNCRSGIDKLSKTIRKHRDVMVAEMDLIMATQKLKANSIQDIAFFWVKGHADEDHPPVYKLSKEQQMNVQCDANANECVAANMEETEFTPLPGT